LQVSVPTTSLAKIYTLFGPEGQAFSGLWIAAQGNCRKKIELRGRYEKELSLFLFQQYQSLRNLYAFVHFFMAL
jgi:hypothetical protein